LQETGYVKLCPIWGLKLLEPEQMGDSEAPHGGPRRAEGEIGGGCARCTEAGKDIEDRYPIGI